MFAYLSLFTALFHLLAILVLDVKIENENEELTPKGNKKPHKGEAYNELTGYLCLAGFCLFVIFGISQRFRTKFFEIFYKLHWLLFIWCFIT